MQEGTIEIVPPTDELDDAELRRELGWCMRAAELEAEQDAERAETTRLYWEHREEGHNVDVVTGCPICEGLEADAERIAAGGRCP